SWISRSASVDLPWSMCATMEKLRILSMAAAVMGRQITPATRSGKAIGSLQQIPRSRREVLGRRQYLFDDALHRLSQSGINLEAKLLRFGAELGILHGGGEGCA